MKLLYTLLFISSFLKSLSQSINPSSIDIVRDAYGVPHIFAKTDVQVAYGLAWAHAEDDFKTIQEGFIVGKTMLGRYKGKKGAQIDFVVKFLRCRELVDSRYEKDVSVRYKTILEAYSEGINAYAKAYPKEVLMRNIFPVTPKDMLTYSILQLCISNGADKVLEKIFNGTIPLNQFKTEGSNAYAFNSKKTIDGNTYLAINSHQPFEGPVAWYEAHLCSEEGWNILGALFPGMPSILHGVNENLGWAHTVNFPDKLDVYQLDINPKDKLQYKFDGTWQNLEVRTSKLKVKMLGLTLGVKKKIYESKYGPTLITNKGTFSIRTAPLMEIRALEQWYWMNKAKNFNEFKKATEILAIPGYNFVYADRFDTIFYLSNGKLPLRNKNYDWATTLPGNTSKTLWTEYHTLNDLPQVLNPPSGYVFNSNHSPFNSTSAEYNLQAKDYDATMGYETWETNRSIRFMELIKNYDKVSYADFKKIKYDMQLPSHLSFRNNTDTLFMLSPEEYPAIADMIATLKNWDRRANLESKGAVIFSIVYNYVTHQPEGGLYYMLTESNCVEILIYTKNYLIKNFGSTEVSLGQYQKLVRGEKEIPLPGLPDVIAAMYSTPHKNGTVKGMAGESYIELVQFTKDGPIIESVNCYGASNKAASPHFADQMEMFVQQKTKPMTLNKAQVYKEAKTVYHPIKK